MTSTTVTAPASGAGYSAAKRLETAGALVLRYGLALTILWFGLFKFTAVEAEAIVPLVRTSPFLSWLYLVSDTQGASRLIGAAEIIIAVLIALRPVSARLSAIGSLGAVVMFCTTLSFLATTSGMWARVEWLVVPAGAGGFIIKDLVLLGASLWTAGEALR